MAARAYDHDDLEQASLKVVRHQQAQARAALEQAAATAAAGDQLISEASALLGELGALPSLEAHDLQPTTLGTPFPAPKLRSWDDIYRDALNFDPSCVDVTDILPADAIDAILAELGLVATEFDDAAQPDAYDYVGAALAGTLAGIASFFLVNVPRHRGLLGTEGAKGGWLSNQVRDRFGTLLPDETIHALERDFPVPFDPATNYGLELAVPGLGPRSHRLQSLGHDPILGWVFGVADVLRGTFTAIGSDGSLIVQSSRGFDPLLAGQGMFVALFEALAKVGGHLLSDVATPAGLPAPLMPLAGFLRFGRIGPRQRTIAELARAMYASGYDFRHFLAGSIPTVLIEVLVRGFFVVRRWGQETDELGALPALRGRALGRMLFVAHATSAAINAGTIAVTQNPLLLNWSQWLALLRYLMPEAYRLVYGHAAAREAHLQAYVSRGWDDLHARVSVTLGEVSAPKFVM
ncbi:MAG: hypothetical protein K2Y37_23620 [Pirellulales bacterium]|nr:hypothetical protein [Pirellulales bacterium]